jgi:hypothetical protein
VSLNVAIWAEWYRSASSALINALGRYASSRGPRQPLITTGPGAAALTSLSRDTAFRFASASPSAS